MIIESEPGRGTTVRFDVPIRRPGQPEVTRVPQVQARAA
jgi:hypothetical protein